jgi:hypothetical protein
MTSCSWFANAMKTRSNGSRWISELSAAAHSRAASTASVLRAADTNLVNSHRPADGERGPLARCPGTEIRGEQSRVMIHPEVLPQEQMECLRDLAPAATDLSFSPGGTAVALQRGHRRSVDFDWFAERFPGMPVDLQKSLAGRGIVLETTAPAEGTVHGRNAGVKVSLLEFQPALLEPLVEWSAIGLGEPTPSGLPRRSNWPEGPRRPQAGRKSSAGDRAASGRASGCTN